LFSHVTDRNLHSALHHLIHCIWSSAIAAGGRKSTPNSTYASKDLDEWIINDDGRSLHLAGIVVEVTATATIASIVVDEDSSGDVGVWEWTISVSANSEFTSCDFAVNGVNRFAFDAQPTLISLSGPNHSGELRLVGDNWEESATFAATRLATSSDRDITTLIFSSIQEVFSSAHEDCQTECNAEFQYTSNCVTWTEQRGCCVVDAQRAACRRACEAFVDANNGEYGPAIMQAIWTGFSYDCDMIMCGLSSIKFW
jgi:hypothetical protein